ncbi:cupin-like domain-containing protein [Stigmatella sp. ncwal1]|uniref:Cupin-like domain-containing protein n=1 Tax=Stigmatella ashevillensis TaxID=2995309 RepID=A0ABT5D3V3_9BACT|nr:cupin-like domain-containing protein [Stigmatella ashevillena]MDC0708337.1 cupin-like domain-containing protein [Stigmatella ashevillena]
MEESAKRLTADEVIRLLQAKWMNSYVQDLEGIIQFEFSCQSDIDFHIVTRKGTSEIKRGRHEQAHLRISLEPADYLGVLAGHVTQLYASGRLRIEGDLGLGLSLARMLSPPSMADWYPDRQQLEEVSARGVPLERIERRDMPSQAVFLGEYAQASRPVILVDVVKTWDVHALSPGRLRAEFGSIRVVPRVGDYVAAAFTSHHTYAQMSLAEYLDLLETAPERGVLPPYLGNNAVPDELLGSIKYPPFFVPTTCGRPNMWLGPAGTITPLHRDLVDNALAQVFGRKRLILFPPEQSRFLYTWSNSKLVDGARVDPELPDLEQFPLFEQASGIQCTLEPGEMLFIPAGWFHKVCSLTPSLSISFFKLYEPPAAMTLPVAS